MTRRYLNTSEAIALGFVIVLMAFMLTIAWIDPQAFMNMNTVLK